MVISPLRLRAAAVILAESPNCQINELTVTLDNVTLADSGLLETEQGCSHGG